MDTSCRRCSSCHALFLCLSVSMNLDNMADCVAYANNNYSETSVPSNFHRGNPFHSQLWCLIFQFYASILGCRVSISFIYFYPALQCTECTVMCYVPLRLLTQSLASNSTEAGFNNSTAANDLCGIAYMQLLTVTQTQNQQRTLQQQQQTPFYSHYTHQPVLPAPPVRN